MKRSAKKVFDQPFFAKKTAPKKSRAARAKKPILSF